MFNFYRRWPISSNQSTHDWLSWRGILRKLLNSSLGINLQPTLLAYNFYSIHSFYKAELETERDPNIRRWLTQQLYDAEVEVLNILRADRERLERENRLMEEALEKIRQRQCRRH